MYNYEINFGLNITMWLRTLDCRLLTSPWSHVRHRWMIVSIHLDYYILYLIIWEKREDFEGDWLFCKFDYLLHNSRLLWLIRKSGKCYLVFVSYVVYLFIKSPKKSCRSLKISKILLGKMRQKKITKYYFKNKSLITTM